MTRLPEPQICGWLKFEFKTPSLTAGHFNSDDTRLDHSDCPSSLDLFVCVRTAGKCDRNIDQLITCQDSQGLRPLAVASFMRAPANTLQAATATYKVVHSTHSSQVPLPLCIFLLLAATAPTRFHHRPTTGTLRHSTHTH